MTNKIIVLYLLCFSNIYAGELTLFIAGDVLPDRGVAKILEKNSIMDFPQSIKNLIDSSDFSIVNLEAPLRGITTKKNKKFIFGAKSSNLEKIKQLGFTHYSLANNHALDQSYLGLINTVDFLTNSGKQVLGLNNDSHNIIPKIIEKKDEKIAIFNYTYFRPDFSYLGDSINVNYLQTNLLAEAIVNFKSKYPNILVLIYLHWGYENTSQIADYQINISETLIKSGADIIIGSHPHEIQKKTFILGKPVYFSLGNFIFDSQAKKGLFLKLFVEKGKIVKIEEYPYKINKCFPLLD